MENLNILKRYLDLALDIESFGDNRLLIVLENNKKVIFKDVDGKTRDFSFEYFGSKFAQGETRRGRGCEEEWTEEEIKYLKENCYSLSLVELSIRLGKKEYKVDRMIKKMELFLRKPWTQDEINYILKNPHMKPLELANKLKRSLASIKSKRRYLRKVGLQAV